MYILRVHARLTRGARVYRGEIRFITTSKKSFELPDIGLLLAPPNPSNVESCNWFCIVNPRELPFC
jgi:hypothetical protein